MEKHLRHIDRQDQARPQRSIPRTRRLPLDVEFQLDALATPSSTEVGLLLAALPNILEELVQALDDTTKD